MHNLRKFSSHAHSPKGESTPRKKRKDEIQETGGPTQPLDEITPQKSGIGRAQGDTCVLGAEGCQPRQQRHMNRTIPLVMLAATSSLWLKAMCLGEIGLDLYLHLTYFSSKD